MAVHPAGNLEKRTASQVGPAPRAVAGVGFLRVLAAAWEEQQFWFHTCLQSLDKGERFPVCFVGEDEAR